MAEEADRPQEDRTEAATPRRLQRAREQGQVALSREIVTLSGLAAFAVLCLVLGPTLLREAAGTLRALLAQSHRADLAGAAAWVVAARASLSAALPFLLAVLVGGVAATLAQTRFLLHGAALQPALSRLSPLAGLQRLAGTDSLADAVRSVLKLILIAAAVVHALPADPAFVLGLPFHCLSVLLGRTAEIGLRILLATLAAQLVIALADLAWVRFRHARRLRMSRQDIRDELKDTEGDPQIRARIRQIRQQRARRRMLAAVPKATVVITNPTHYAVALAYDRAKQAAPRVVAKGVDTVAARIREVAEAHRVPIVANPPLARALHRVELDAEIPAEHYQAVAEIVAYVWRLGRRAGGVAS